MNKEKSELERGTPRKHIWLAIPIAIIPLALVACFTLYNSNQPAETEITETTTATEKTTFDLTEDSNTKDGEIEKDTTITDKLNEQVAQSMVNVSMNSNPVFTDGVGNVLITNSVENHTPQVVEIYYGEEQIYQSGVIPVGSNVASASLDTALAEGDYDCTAYFNSIDSETGELLGRVGINIKVTVK